MPARESLVSPMDAVSFPWLMNVIEMLNEENMHRPSRVRFASQAIAGSPIGDYSESGSETMNASELKPHTKSRKMLIHGLQLASEPLGRLYRTRVLNDDVQIQP
jgi:hypothetical protein